MMFSCFELDDKSKALAITMGANGELLEYAVTPMGLKIPPDFVQAAIEQILDGLGVDNIWMTLTYLLPVLTKNTCN